MEKGKCSIDAYNCDSDCNKCSYFETRFENIKIGDIVYYKCPLKVESYGFIIAKAKFIDNEDKDTINETFYYVRKLYDKTTMPDVVLERDIKEVYKKL